YVARLRETRRQRLHGQDRAAWHAINAALRDPAAEDKDALLARLGALAFLADMYDPLVTGAEAVETITPSGAVFHGVWPTAAEWRRNGTLLALGTHIQCPVVAVHGDYDPHPADGVQQPLSTVLRDFRLVLLQHCGHTPWRERQARDSF